MKLTKIQQKFMRWVEEADKYGEVAYFEFGMFKPFYRRTCDSLLKKGLIEQVEGGWDWARVRLVKEGE